MIFFHYKNFLLLYYIKIMKKKITMKLKTCTSYSLPNKNIKSCFFLIFLFLIIHDFIFNICYLFCNIIYLYYFIIYIHITNNNIIIIVIIIKMKNSIFGESKFFFAKVIAFISFPKNRRRNWNSIPAFNLIFLYIHIYRFFKPAKKISIFKEIK